MARGAGRRARGVLLWSALLALLVPVGLSVGAAPAAAAEGVQREQLRIPGTPEPDGRAVTLDATLFLPASEGPAPAVLLAHGFGGTKESVTAQAADLAGQGYVVLAYTARGFGRSGGDIHLDSPDYEVADASLLLDRLARRPEVLQDGTGDPRVGVAGASYGGALALLLAGTDRRVDAVAPMITWNDLSQALFPQQAVSGAPPRTPADVTPVPTAGVFKRLWAGRFFTTSSVGGPGGTCGRFAADVCEAYQQVAGDSVPTRRILDLLRRSSPATVLDAVRAPTLLVQGESDSLFPLSQADANAAGVAATGTPVKVVWADGGHDSGFDPQDAALRGDVLAWFGRYLRRDGSPADTTFDASVPRTVRTRADRDRGPAVQVAPGLPGAGLDVAVPTTSVPLSGAPQRLVSPAGGNPAAITSVPGLGALGAALDQLTGTGLDTSAGSRLPGQTAAFSTGPLPRALRVVGAPRVRVSVRSTTGDATLFAALYDVAPDGSASLPQRLVAPVRLTGLPAAGRTVTLSLPAVVRDVAVGHRLRLVVSSTDSAYAMPSDARLYTVGLAGGSALLVPLAVPGSEGGRVEQGGGVGVARLLLLAGALAALLLLAVLVLVLRRRRATHRDVDADLAGVPIAVVGLGKAYGDGYRAVSDLSFRVDRGQVLGLLGPNGAGKTTTLRMLLGLIAPTEGELRLFGHRVRAGAPVLSRVGALVEGPGFLPHLSGAANLSAFWAATGRRPEDAHVDVALQISGLGADLERKVRTYSHGMRQRLAIAQAMLGLPDVLVLDEPTNGLDPPQIREMREVLRSYATTGRTVVVSSHLLAEVEATCSHVVVMHHGRLVAAGEVATLVGTATVLVVDVDDPARAAEVAAGLDGARDVTTTPTGLVLRLVGTPRGDLVRALVDAGLQVEGVTPQHGLEEAFLSLVGEG